MLQSRTKTTVSTSGAGSGREGETQDSCTNVYEDRKDSKIRLGIIGSWGHFVHVLDDIEKMPEVEVVGLARALPGEDFSGVRAKYSSTASVPLYDDYRQLLSEQSPDVVTISTRLDQITPVAIEVAGAGCNLVCEKPLAITHAGLGLLWEAVKANGVECLAMLNNRVHPLLAAAAKAVGDGLIGKVCLLNARKSYRFGNRPEWFGRRETYGGTIPWVGIHALDFIDAVADSAFTSVAAMHANAVHPERPGCEDACTMVFRLENGALATASIDYLRPKAASTHGDDWLRIVGENGVIEVGMDREKASIITNTEPLRDLTAVKTGPYYAPLLRSLMAKERSAEPGTATKRSFSLTHAALCARDAADTGAVVGPLPAMWDGLVGID